MFFLVFSNVCVALDVSKLKIVEVNSKNINVVANLSQPYEAEFSVHTKALPNQAGLYPIYLHQDGKHKSYLVYDKSIPIAFAIKRQNRQIARYIRVLCHSRIQKKRNWQPSCELHIR